jgi:hypothetical protein
VHYKTKQMDIERRNFLNECQQEAQKLKENKILDSFEKKLINHLGVLQKELKDNGGVPPQHRIEEERRQGLI